ncbi:MAG: two-component sensor histidine kinase [Paenibacillaceae bacterium]|jgi:two-component system sensor histidine kinase YesM|nr:two-component sensor histidine kinase [Paenibacillaceae bacterium]
MRRRTSSLTFKLFVICLIFVLVCVLIIGQLSARFVKQQLTNREQEFVGQILSKVNEYLTLNFSSMQTILFSVDSFLGTQEESGIEENRLGRHLEMLYEMNLQHISNVYVIRNDLSLIGGRTITRIANEPMPELAPVYDDSISGGYFSTKVSSLYYSRFSGWTITISRISRYDPSLVIAVDLNLMDLSQKLLMVHQQERIQLFIANYSGQVLVYSNGIQSGVPDTIGAPATIGGMEMDEIVRANNSTIPPEGANSGEQLVVKLHSPTYNWLLVAASDGSRMAQILRQIDAHFIQLSLIGLVLSLVTSIFITRYIRKPVFELIGKMKQVEQGRLDVQVITQRSDEFGYLSRNFDKMLMQIADLFRHLEDHKEQQKNLEIQVLQSQINPHFLYNTLGAVSNVVRLGQLDKVDPVIRSLISILEYGVKNPAQKVSLQEELYNVRNYVVIQNIRYNKNFPLVERIDPGLLDFKVFRMFLQPIVENSIFHGYRGGREEGEIRISAYRKEDRVVVEVADSGIGIDSGTLQHLLEQKTPEEETDPRSRIGLANIHGRIKLHYGNPYGLDVTGEPNKGVCVRAEFPIGQKEERQDEPHSLSDRG